MGKADSLGIDGAWIFTPEVHQDARGSFFESFRGDELARALGYRLDVAQANWSVSPRGVIRGIHFADVPPGQAKYVSRVHGAMVDVVADTRVGLPRFGRWEAVRLEDENRRSVFIGEGPGHALMALTDQCTAVYLCSAPYAPGREHGFNPLGTRIGIDWPADVEPVLSPKDADAPSLTEARRNGLLPRHADCAAYIAGLREGQAVAHPLIEAHRR